MKTQHHIVEADDVSKAWAQVILKLHSRGVNEISPLFVTVHLPGGQPAETQSIRTLADEELRKQCKPKGPDLFECATTANTIFPKSLWRPGMDRQEFYARYKRLLPRMKSHSRNKMGIYFERLIAFGGDNNQLEHILKTWEKGNRRRSEFQAITVDPHLDQSDAPMRGFPCLRQVMFIPTKEGLIVSGIYGVQYVFDRAYGNYLGLCHLGQFMAHEMGLPLIKLQCVTSIAELGSVNKTELQPMIQTLTDVLAIDAHNKISIEDPVPLIPDNTLSTQELYVQTR